MRTNAPLIIYAGTFIVYLAYCISIYTPFTFAWADPGWMVQATISLTEDFDLDIRNQLFFDPRGISDQTALGVRGEWFPIHEPLLSLVGVPLYLLGGVPGCLITNVLILSLLSSTIFLLLRTWYTESTALMGVIALCFGSPLFFYSYSYSVDVLGVVLGTLSLLAAVRGKYFCCGGLYVVAVMARITLAPLIVFHLLYLSTHHGARPQIMMRFLSGCITLGVFQLFNNFNMFGDPFVMPYHRQAILSDGEVVLNHLSVFRQQHIGDGLIRVLFDEKEGLFFSIPWVLLSLYGLVLLWSRRTHLSIALCCSISIMLICGAWYNAFPGAFGNRYLFICYVLLIIPMCETLDVVRRKKDAC